MRISDWSSDVCSSDLSVGLPDDRFHAVGLQRVLAPAGGTPLLAHRTETAGARDLPGLRRFLADDLPGADGQEDHGLAVHLGRRARIGPRCAQPRRRSEEHTSELQSLMRISYAVFCLQKKKHTISIQMTQRHQK